MNFAVIAQQVERILGKDEVPGSNPGISSRKAVSPVGEAAFLRFQSVFEPGTI